MFHDSAHTRVLGVALLCAIAGPAARLQAEPSVANLSWLPTVAELAFAQGDRSSDHPKWVTDLEAKAWPGFLTGMSGYDNFVFPVGMPIYFEDPFITTDIRPFYIYHEIPKDSVLRGGQVHVVGLQIRAALTERLSFLATKDGYSWVDSHVTQAGEGWNDIAIGLKYAVHSVPEEEFLVSVGLKWEWQNGSREAFQGRTQEFNPFVSFAKGWDKWHFIGALNGRIPASSGQANSSFLWNLHMDYALTDTFRPLVELHGIHWLSNADQLPFSQDYLDVGSLGASKASGTDFFSAGIGFRWQAMKDFSVGVTWEFPLESASAHLMEQRVTVNTRLSF